MDEREERAKLVEVARSFVGTPYRDCAMVKGPDGGVDCATLLKLAFEEAGLEPPIEVEPYSPQWYLHRNEEKYLNKLLERAKEIPEAEAHPGDVVLYKFGRCFAHGAIIIDPGFPAIVHAHKQSGAVVIGRGNAGPLGIMPDGKIRPRRFFTRKSWGA